jgi:hypothetical protein
MPAATAKTTQTQSKPEKVKVNKTVVLKPIATTRFTTETHVQFNRFGAAKGVHWYGTPKRAPQTIDMGHGTIVIEMNNTENKIEGIGLIAADGYHRRQPIYHEPSWCRHTYRRESWLSPAELQERMSKDHWEMLHRFMFKSIHNQKRWNGITGWNCHNAELTTVLLRLRQELLLRVDVGRRALIDDTASSSAAVHPRPVDPAAWSPTPQHPDPTPLAQSPGSTKSCNTC